MQKNTKFVAPTFSILRSEISLIFTRIWNDDLAYDGNETVVGKTIILKKACLMIVYRHTLSVATNCDPGSADSAHSVFFDYGRCTHWVEHQMKLEKFY